MAPRPQTIRGQQLSQTRQVIGQSIRQAQSTEQQLADQLKEVKRRQEQVGRSGVVTREQLQRRGRAGIIAQARQQKKISETLSSLKGISSKVKTARESVKKRLKKLIQADTEQRSIEKAGGISRFKPIFVKGKIAGFEDLAKGQSIGVKEKERRESRVTDLDLALQPDIVTKQQKELTELLKKQKVDVKLLRPSASVQVRGVDQKGLPPTEREVKPRRVSEVTIPPTFLQRLKRSIKQNTPDIKILPKDLNKLAGGIIGVTFGAEEFTREEVKKVVDNLRDVKGRKIFTTTQAERLTDLGFEVTEGFVLGAVAGKTTTLARGGLVLGAERVLPKAVTTSKLVRKAAVLTELGVAAGITGFELIKVNKTFKEQGEKEGLLRLVGLASFGVGFSKTGLKTTPQARREFTEFAYNVIKLPKGRAGKAAIRPGVTRSKLVSAGELKRAKARAKKSLELKAAVERELINRKTLKDQLRVLAEIKNKVGKDPKAVGEFNKFVRELVDKRILKTPTVEVAPGIKVTGLPIPEKVGVIEFGIPKPPIKEAVGKFVLAARNRSKKEIEFSRTPFAERVSKAQRKVTKDRQVGSLALRNVQRQGEKLRSLQLQGASQQQLQQQGSALASAQANLSRTLQKQKLLVSGVTKGLLFPAPSFLLPKVPLPFGFLGKPKTKRRLVPILVAKRGYFAEFKPARGKKFVRINKVPTTKERARDAMAWLVDRTLSAKGRIIKAKRPARRLQLNIPKGYFGATQNKFRQFKIQQGKIIPTPNTWVEKRGRPRLDTLSEKKRIKGFQELARLRKKKLRLNNPPRLRSTFGKKKSSTKPGRKKK